MQTKYIILLIISSIFWSCEEDVILDLANIEKNLVVEAYVSNADPVAKVSLSYSQGFYDTPDFDLLTNATVTITDQNGVIEQLKLNSENVFLSSNLQANFGNEYNLKVEVDDQIVEVSTKIPSNIQIGNTIFVPNPFMGSDDSLNIFVNVPDEVGVDNYFRLKVNKFRSVPGNEYYVVDDTFGKDGIISMPIYFKTFTWGDTVIVELQHLKRDIYDYYIGLSDNLNGSFNSIAPGNPISNMPDGVLGFIAGMSIDIDTVIVSAPMF